MPEKKRSFQKLLLTALFLLAVTLGTTTGVQAKENPGSLIVYTVNYPLQYFAQRIAGHDAKVVFPAQAKGDPAFWAPDAQAVAEFQQADLILLNGANYAKWLDRVSLPRFRLVNTSAGFKDSYLVTREGCPTATAPVASTLMQARRSLRGWISPRRRSRQRR